MTSQLASQLQRLQQRPSSSKHLSVSFLFEKNDARSFTREQIHQLAATGLQTLVVLDNRFHAFIEPLFSAQKTRLERARLGTQENKEIDRLLDHLLTLLSPHLFLTAAQQVFEYLVRVYEVHVYNVMAVLRTFLPYHDHNLFARVLMMLDLRDTGFQFMTTNQERGAPLLREHLILAAAESRKVLRLVGLTMALSVRYKVQNNAANALFAAVAVGLSTHAEAESIWRALVPFVLECLSGEVNGTELGEADAVLNFHDEEEDDAQVGRARRNTGAEPENREAVCTALVVLASWCCEVQFTAPMMSALMKPLLQFLQSGTSSRPVVPLIDLLHLLDLLFTTQLSVVQALPFAGHLAALVDMPWAQWMPRLSETVAQYENVQAATRADVPLRALVTVLLQYALDRLAVAQSLDVVPRAVLSFLQLAAEALPLSQSVVKSYLHQLMTYDAKHAQDDGEETQTPASASATSNTFLNRVTLALEGRYQRTFDETLSELLQTSSMAETSSTMTPVTAAERAAKKEASEGAVRFLARHLGGARYQMLTVKTRGSEAERLPLFTCLLHPLPAVRQTALEALRQTPLSDLCSSSRHAGQRADLTHNEEEEEAPQDGAERGAASGTHPRYPPDAKGSLLELLAHVTEFETDVPTAQLVAEVCAGVLVQLSHGVMAKKAAAKSKGKQSKAPSADAAMPDATFCANACCLLLRALHHLTVTHTQAVCRTYLDKALRPLLVELDSHNNHKAAASDASTCAMVRSCVVFHAVQIYLLTAHAVDSERALAEEAAALLKKAYPTLTSSSSTDAAQLFTVETPSAVVPSESSGSNSAGRRRKAATSDSSDDDEGDKGKDAHAAKSAAAANTSSLSLCAGPVLGVWMCPALLLDAWAEAEHQLPGLHTRVEQLARAASAASSSSAVADHAAQTEATELALCLAVASQLNAEPTAGATALQQFLVGHSPSSASAELKGEEDEEAEASRDTATISLRRRGYLGLCASLQRLAARQALSSESRAAVGRGVQNSVLAADYLPQDGLTRRLAAIAQATATLWLTKSKVPVATLKTLLQTVGLLGGALPALALNPNSLSPAFFELIQPSSSFATSSSPLEPALMAYPVDWFYLVYDALARHGTMTSTTAPTSRGALALVLLLPLWAPRAHRTALLQELQGALLQGQASGSRAAKPTTQSSTRLVLCAAMQDKTLALSLTAVSSVIEAMAREESRFQLTSSASDLIAQLLVEPVEVVETPEERERATPACGYVVPPAMAADVITYFFAPVEQGETKQTKKKSASSSSGSGAQLNLTILLPRLLSLLKNSQNDRDKDEKTKKRSKTAHREHARASAEVPMEAALFLEVVCRRAQLVPTSSLANDGAVTLCTALLRTPFLSTRGFGGAVCLRPVYRLALTMLAAAMQQGQLLEKAANSQSQAGPLIFTQKSKAATASGHGGEAASMATEEAYLCQVAALLRPLVLSAVNTVGSDVATFCVQTVGGFHRFFLPFLTDLTTTQPGSAERAALTHGGEAPLEVLLELVRALAPNTSSSAARQMNELTITAEQTDSIGDAFAASSAAAVMAASHLAATRWLPSASCALSNPLTFEHAMTVMDVVSNSLCPPAASSPNQKPKKSASLSSSPSAAVVQWEQSGSHLVCLDLLCALLQASPAIVFDDDEEEEGSLFTLVRTMLERFPVSGMCPLLMPEADEVSPLDAAPTAVDGSHRLVTPSVKRVLQLLHDLTYLCAHQAGALSEHNPQNPSKIRSTLIKQSLLVMATMLTTSAPSARAGDEVEAADDWSRARIDVITELLRALAPLFSLRNPLARGAAGDHTATVGGVNAYLHIPLAALLIRLEPVERTEALRYKSAVEVCQEVLGSFDVHTQIVCLSQLMRLVVDPAAQLAPETLNEEAMSSATHGGTDDGALEAVKDTLHLFRRMVKPNQVINRQEAILALVNLSVKADSFLGPFIELQHRSVRSVAKARAGQKDGAEDAEDGDDQEATTRKAEEGTHTSEECMQLLVSALELFSHYSDLNAQTSSDEATQPNGEVTNSEEKSYVMLLELLAGNALACVLAGINEPTFVSCLQRLLADRRTALQLKGLEVLLDRLHHSLPTVENTLTDAELEQHRRELRDPRKRLTLADLIRIKARPLTTKRSFSLYPLVETVLRAAIRSLYAATRSSPASATMTTSASVQLTVPLSALDVMFQLAQLSCACMEELVRIVSSGGSTQAEKTLLNTSRSKRVTEAMLSKLFGNKARVQEVHHTVSALCAEWLPQLTQCTQRLYQSSPTASTSSHAAAAAASSGDSQPARHSSSAPSFDAAPTRTPSHTEAASPAVFTAPTADYLRLAEDGFLGVLTVLLTMLASTVQAMGVAFTAPHCLDVLQSIVAASVFQVVELPSLVAQSAMGSLLRRTTLSAFVRCYSACWHFSQPSLPRIIFAATHLVNVSDPETNYLSTELLTVLEALLDPQLFLEACAVCLRGTPYVNVAVIVGANEQNAALSKVAATNPTSRRPTPQLRLLVATHSFFVFFQCVQRRVQSLRKEEMKHIPILVDGTTPADNFWLSAFETLATTSTMPPAEVLKPVLDTFTTFFLKFKPKHCTKFLRIVCEWAFAAAAGTTNKKKGSDSDEEGSSAAAAAAKHLSRTSIHRWLVFYALANHLLEKLGAILDFGFPVLVPYVTSTLHTYCSAGTHPAKQHASLLALTLEGALACVRRMAAAQTPGPDYDYSIPLDIFFATPEVFNALMPALVHQLTNLALLQDDVHSYSFRAEHAVIPAVRAFFACLQSGKLQSKTQAELARGLRHPSRVVRCQTLMCLDGIYADGGEELASRLMAEVLPAVVELTEDRDDDVVEAARTMCTNLSNMTGQDVLHAMS